MPYRWTTTPEAPTQVLQLWPHNALPARGMAAFVLATFTLILIPTLTLLGSPILWGILPFALLAVWGVYFALQSNWKQRQISEELTLAPDAATLTRTEPNGIQHSWDCNRYWCQVKKYDTEGPVPHYLTLRGSGREVEIGAFLSEDERLTLYEDLTRALK